MYVNLWPPPYGVVSQPSTCFESFPQASRYVFFNDSLNCCRMFLYQHSIEEPFVLFTLKTLSEIVNERKKRQCSDAVHRSHDHMIVTVFLVVVISHRSSEANLTSQTAYILSVGEVRLVFTSHFPR